MFSTRTWDATMFKKSFVRKTDKLGFDVNLIRSEFLLMHIPKRLIIVVTAGSRQWPGLKDPRISCIENTKLKRRRREREKERG